MKSIRPYLLLLAVFATTHALSQKAFETVVYRGKVNNSFVKFSLADGYVAASKLTTSAAGSRQVKTYLPADSQPDDRHLVMQRVSAKNSARSDYFVIDLDATADAIPSTLTCRYFVKGKSYKCYLHKGAKKS
jgi:hypothetical protein